MVFRKILLHLDGGPDCESRIAAAVALAGRSGARLDGLFAELDPGLRTRAAAPAASPEGPGRSGPVEAVFRARAAAAGVAARWHDGTAVHDSQVMAAVTAAARAADLTVLGPDHHQGDGFVPNDLAEQTALHAGRPILVVPPGGDPGFGQRVMIAWNAGGEAARAMADALPFLVTAEEVVLVHVIVSIAHEAGFEADVAGAIDYLDCHGVKARAERIAVEDVGAMDMVLARAGEFGSDLLVIGAHGHVGFPLFRRGSATRFMLRQTTLPVFLSH